MNFLRFLIVPVLAAAPVCGADFSEIAATPHPRILFPRAAEAALQEKLAADPLAARLQKVALERAERVLGERTCRYEIPDGRRLLGESRRAFLNVMSAGWAWRLGAGEPYRLRVLAEIEAACGLKDWNPPHFLDTAEMAAAVAVGYDWLYDTLTPAQREMCERALVEKGLRPALAAYRKGERWTRPRNNWTQVCGAGIAIAAAAVADVEPELAADLYQRGLRLTGASLAFYQPDGMYPEGPAYWHYGTNYHVLMLATAGALGSPAADDPVFRKAGDSIMHLTGPTRNSFNFADSRMHMETPSAAQCWIASRYGDATQTAFVRSLFDRVLREEEPPETDRFFPFSILWLPGDPGDAELRTAAVFRGKQAVATFRTSWEPDACWLAIKGGTPAASHGHMDAGSFVYEARGIRWIEDIGSENYNLPGYFGGKRWTYYRLQNRSHNTLEIAGELQNPDADPCPVEPAADGGVVIDLGSAYRGAADIVRRTAAFDPETGAATLTDRVKGATGPVIWRAFTRAGIELDGRRAVLRTGGKSIALECAGDAVAWRIGSAKPPTDEENPNDGYRALELEIPTAAEITVSVKIRP